MRKGSKTGILFLAYFLRYGYIALMLIAACIFGDGREVFLCIGIGLVLTGVHYLLGYLLRWRHVFCAWQEAGRQKMTPFYNDWDEITKKEAYGLPAVCVVAGILSVVGWLIF